MRAYVLKISSTYWLYEKEIPTLGVAYLSVLQYGNGISTLDRDKRMVELDVRLC